MRSPCARGMVIFSFPHVITIHLPRQHLIPFHHQQHIAVGKPFINQSQEAEGEKGTIGKPPFLFYALTQRIQNLIDPFNLKRRNLFIRKLSGSFTVAE